MKKHLTHTFKYLNKNTDFYHCMGGKKTILVKFPAVRPLTIMQTFGKGVSLPLLFSLLLLKGYKNKRNHFKFYFHYTSLCVIFNHLSISKELKERITTTQRETLASGK